MRDGFNYFFIIVPKSQVDNLYGSIKKNKENKNPQEKNKDQDNANKKPQKKDKPQEPPKPKPPKSIESALNIVSSSSFISCRIGINRLIFIFS